MREQNKLDKALFSSILWGLKIPIDYTERIKRKKLRHNRARISVILRHDYSLTKLDHLKLEHKLRKYFRERLEVKDIKCKFGDFKSFHKLELVRHNHSWGLEKKLSIVLKDK